MIGIVEDILKEKGVSVGVTNVAVVKPLDTSWRNIDTRLVVTLEDNVLSGGFGESFSAYYKNEKFGILNIAIPDEFIEHGDIPSLRKLCGIDAESIANRILKIIQ